MIRTHDYFLSVACSLNLQHVLTVLLAVHSVTNVTRYCRRTSLHWLEHAV
jgi:predicted 2-oxoglutarate/Fe(II)-dependent dioxygenase YbiX